MSNQWGIKYDALTQWRNYENLPAQVREVYQRAPYNYYIVPAIIKLAAVDAECARRNLIRQMRDDAAREVLRTYGPDHPNTRGLVPLRSRA